MKKNKFNIVLVLFVAAIVLIYFWQVRNPKSGTEGGHTIVAASFYPLAHFAEQVGGSMVSVVNITPPDTEPHDYEPTPKQLAEIYKSDLLIGNGGGIDPWVTQIRADVEKQHVSVIMLADTIDISFKLVEGSTTDPHIWLDPILASREVESLRDAIIAIDPANRVAYNSNAQNYIDQLHELDLTYTKSLANCVTKDFVTAHTAFGYLARRYGLNQIGIAGLNPETEPSAAQLAEITNLVREKQIHYIFFETLTSPKLAQVLAREVGAEVLVLNPLEGLTPADIAGGKTYISVMNENLKALKQALSCS